MSVDWATLLGEQTELYVGFLTSLAIGLFIGLERERNPTAKAGLRTFTLVALFGALCATLSETFGSYWLLAVGLALAGWMIIAAYSEDDGREEDGVAA